MSRGSHYRQEQLICQLRSRFQESFLLDRFCVRRSGPAGNFPCSVARHCFDQARGLQHSTFRWQLFAPCAHAEAKSHSALRGFIIGSLFRPQRWRKRNTQRAGTRKNFLRNTMGMVQLKWQAHVLGHWYYQSFRPRLKELWQALAVDQSHDGSWHTPRSMQASWFVNSAKYAFCVRAGHSHGVSSS